MLFIGVIRLLYLGICAGLGLACVPIMWNHLHNYQKGRILSFLNPELDPLGTGYNLLQSQIAIGSGGFLGKGFVKGTQTQLSFLPEKQTDFIFTLLCEEWGFMGGAFLLSLYILLIVMCFRIIMMTQNDFGRFVAAGMTVSFFFYIFINVAMVMGLAPVVGVPMPLLSYGGTVMTVVMIGFGLSGCSFNIVVAAFGKLVPERMRSLAFGAGTAAGSFGQFLFAPVGALVPVTGLSY